MKKKYLSIAILSSIPFSLYATTDYYTVVIGKENNSYNHETASLLPKKDGVSAVVKNENTNSRDSGNLFLENLSIESESGDLINISTDIKDRDFQELELKGNWTSNLSLSSSFNDKNRFSFVTPNYDGDILLSLNLTDGSNSKLLKTIVIENEHWISTTPAYTEWEFDSVVTDWFPSLDSYFENESINQSRIIKRTREKQEKELRPSTGSLRSIGSKQEEVDDSHLETKTSFGTKSYWEVTDTLMIQDWTRDNSYISSWTPDASLYFENEDVPQTKEYKETKITQKREYRPATDQYRNVGVEIEEERFGSDDKTVLGSKPYWEMTSQRLIQDWEIDSSYSNYVWTPSVSSRYENESISQTREKREIKIVTNQEYRPMTDEYRDTGNQIPSERLSIENRSVSGDLEYWEDTEPYVVSDWVVDESYPSSWIPSSASYYENINVEQQKEIKKVRTIRDREYRPKTGDYKYTSANKTDISIITAYQTVKGDQEYWVNTGSSSCTDWTFSNNTVWTPSAAEYERTETLTQSRDRFETRECSGQQHRPATNEYRYATAETESRTIQESRTTYGSKIDLNDWFTGDSNGNWSVSDDGTYVYQSINGNPTVFESAADTYGNVKISGVIKIGNDGDDDFVGMVLGKTDPNNFIVWAWKRGNQGASLEGHYLAKVTGGVGKITWNMHLNSDGYQVLDTNISTSIGWEYETYYSFDVIYTPTKVEVWVEGTKVLESSGSFDTGKIGFYNNSQSRVEYYKVVEESLK